jgi:hypothetical protein
MLVGDMRVSSNTDRQTTDLQCDALLDAGMDPGQLFAHFAGPLGLNAPHCTMRSHVTLQSMPCRDGRMSPQRALPIRPWGRVPAFGYNSKALGFVDPMGR